MLPKVSVEFPCSTLTISHMASNTLTLIVDLILRGFEKKIPTLFIMNQTTRVYID